MKYLTTTLITLISLFSFGQNGQDHPIELKQSDTTFIIHLSDESVGISGNKTYYSFKNFQIHKYQGAVIGKVLDGNYQVFIQNKLAMEGRFDQGLKKGVWRAWWPSGKLKEEISWKDGREDGPFIRLDEQGNHLISGNYRNGQFDGEIIRGKNKDIIRKYENGDEAKEQDKELFKKIKILFEKKDKEQKEKIAKPKKDKKSRDKDKSSTDEG